MCGSPTDMVRRMLPRWAFLREVWRLGRTLRGERYDLGVDVRGDVLSILVLALGGVSRRVGFAMRGWPIPADRRRRVDGWPSRGPFLAWPCWTLWGSSLTSPREPPCTFWTKPGSPLPTGCRKPGPVAFRDVREVSVRSMTSRVGDDWDEVASTLEHASESQNNDPADWLHADHFRPHLPFLTVHLGAGTAAKRWPRRHWKTLVEKFLKDGWRVVIIGGPEDPPLSRILDPHEQLLDWSGRLSVTQTTALLKRADLFIGADSGPAHLAASAGTRSVILFSGTNNPMQWRPWSKHATVSAKTRPLPSLSPKDLSSFRASLHGRP